MKGGREESAPRGNTMKALSEVENLNERQKGENFQTERHKQKNKTPSY